MLRGKAYLIGQFSYIINRVVTRSIQLKNIEGSTVFHAGAGTAHTTSFHVGSWVFAVDGFG
jgi:hypothetical protein